MIDAGKKNILGVMIDAVDYEAAVERIMDSARNCQSLAVTALAVHGVMTGALDKVHASRLNRLGMVVPDGQPVRWALNLLHGSGLPDRCYGPTLTLKVCERAAREGVPIYLYGSRPAVVKRLTERLTERFPGLRIAGSRPSLFRKTTPDEKLEIAQAIRESGARIVFVGLGCPRQEVWAYEYQDLLPMSVLAVGAAFDFHAGLTPQAPPLLQDLGLEWLFRFVSEPRRLWRRYVLLNPLYLSLLALQASGLRSFVPERLLVPRDQELYG